MAKKKIKTIWYYNGIEEHQFIENTQPAGYSKGRKPRKLSDEAKQKMIENQKKHFLEKYGVEWATKLESIQCKRKYTTLIRYGVPCNLNIPEIKEKTKIALRSEELKLKRKQMFKQNYGVENVYQLKSVKNKIKETKLKRYGNEYYSNQEKARQTIAERFGSLDNFYNYVSENIKQFNIKKFGVPYYTQSLQYHKLARKFYYYDNISFDSSWELAVYIYAKDKEFNIERSPIVFEYIFKGKKHKYIPDFKINDKLVEIKSDHFFEENKMINPYDRTQDDLYEAKHQCMINNNVEIWKSKEIEPILNYIIQAYSINWLEKVLERSNI